MLEGVGLEEDNASEQRGFRDGADLRLGAIDTTNVNRERERGRKGDNQKSPKTVQIYQDILKKEYVCVKMYKHMTCKVKSIMGLAQSNPTSTQAYYTHLNV